MVEAMGEEKEKFKRYCFLAYTTLRKSSNLILNLVTLMIDAGIEHINQGDKSVLKVSILHIFSTSNEFLILSLLPFNFDIDIF